MHSVAIRSPTQGPSASIGNTQRLARRTPSFLSLRREKNKSSSTVVDPSGLPLQRPKQTYFDVYPRPVSNPTEYTSKSKAREQRRPSPTRTDPSYHDNSSFPTKKRKEKSQAVKPQVEPCYLFPSFDQEDDGLGGGETPRPYPRPRSRTGPSSKIPSWTDVSSIPPPRFSGSSTRTHYDTPPRTPVDIISSFRGYSVEVAAPVSGVETMDALVDGMNGGDDIMGSSMPSRARFGIPGHHPLYQPPLPTPPPGVILGGGKRRGRSRPSRSSTSDEEDSPPKRSSSPPTRRRQNRLPSSSRTASNSTITIAPSLPDSESEDVDPPLSNHTLNTISRRPVTAPVPERLRTVPPSISEIIRNHAPPEAQARSRPATSQSSSMYGSSQGHGTVYEEPESEPEPVTADEEAELMSRSSIDSIADEVRRTLRNQNVSTVAPPSLQHAHTFPKRYSILSDNASISSPRSDLGAEPSIYSSSAASSYPPSSPFEAPSFLTVSRPSPSQAVAQYLRSTRLTTLLKLTRSPHASHDNPLTVSLSDLGSPSGFPLVVFLGLGCVRHVMGLYDEMAECLGLRLITIDRWGLGRTEPRAKSSKGIMEWASVVEEVLDLLHIGQCSVMAHSAGAPYALSFANKLPNRIRGDICLLAPWVGGSESGSYKWLKYVPNGILKTAQAAEWKLQAWMIGKPPTLAYQGIGYNLQTAPAHAKPSSRKSSPPRSNGHLGVISSPEGKPRPSIGSLHLSEYDDLGDFEGRFESRSTLGGVGRTSIHYNGSSGDNKLTVNKRKVSKGFIERLKGGPSKSQPQSPTEDKPSPGRRLKALRSMGSLKGKSASLASSSKRSLDPTPKLPHPIPIALDIGLGFDDINWTKSITSEPSTDESPVTPEKFSSNAHGPCTRAEGRRSISFTSPRSSPQSLIGSPARSTFDSPYGSIGTGSAYQAALGNALIAASHAESAKGTHNDLLQILNHDNHPWGFSYSAYPHRVRVWYGDKDEKIAENAVRWMERVMGADKCHVKVVKGADHGLMYKSSVVVEVLERVGQNDH